ncbi:MAG: hypothetical protein GX605_11910, partial [Chloroflexi bacterium]|nr:hypothetical protein [Chloroflexota bacterium]
FALTGERERQEAELERLYAAAGSQEPDAEALAWGEAQLERVTGLQAEARPLVELVLEQQVAEALRRLQLTTGDRVWPPVRFRLSTSPLHLTISPRQVIGVRDTRDLRADLPLDLQVRLESAIDALPDVVSLIEPTGGYGVYPTMVLETADLAWTAETVAHEWVHNHLVFWALGRRYFDSPQMRSINETVADIVGVEVGREVLRAHYPALLPVDSPAPGGIQAGPPEPAALDFVREMRLTRQTVDELLAQGQVEEAEQYMEERRQFFVEQGIALRKLNQAYFAFHGTYATGPAASAADPIGVGLTALRDQSPTLREFVHLVRGLRTYEEFERLMAEQGIALAPAD